jgi:hypothetical protein
MLHVTRHCFVSRFYAPDFVTAQAQKFAIATSTCFMIGKSSVALTLVIPLCGGDRFEFQPEHPLHLLTSCSWALLEKPPIVQLLKNFPAFYGTRRFITVSTTALHWSLSWARSIQSITLHPVSLRSILVLSTYVYLETTATMADIFCDFSQSHQANIWIISILGYICFIQNMFQYIFTNRYHIVLVLPALLNNHPKNMLKILEMSVYLQYGQGKTAAKLISSTK